MSIFIIFLLLYLFACIQKLTFNNVIVNLISNCILFTMCQGINIDVTLIIFSIFNILYFGTIQLYKKLKFNWKKGVPIIVLFTIFMILGTLFTSVMVDGDYFSNLLTQLQYRDRLYDIFTSQDKISRAHTHDVLFYSVGLIMRISPPHFVRPIVIASAISQSVIVFIFWKIIIEKFNKISATIITSMIFIIVSYSDWFSNSYAIIATGQSLLIGILIILMFYRNGSTMLLRYVFVILFLLSPSHILFGLLSLSIFAFDRQNKHDVAMYLLLTALISLNLSNFGIYYSIFSILIAVIILFLGRKIRKILCKIMTVTILKYMLFAACFLMMLFLITGDFISIIFWSGIILKLLLMIINHKKTNEIVVDEYMLIFSALIIETIYMATALAKYKFSYDISLILGRFKNLLSVPFYFISIGVLLFVFIAATIIITTIFEIRKIKIKNAHVLLLSAIFFTSANLIGVWQVKLYDKVSSVEKSITEYVNENYTDDDMVIADVEFSSLKIKTLNTYDGNIYLKNGSLIKFDFNIDVGDNYGSENINYIWRESGAKIAVLANDNICRLREFICVKKDKFYIVRRGE